MSAARARILEPQMRTRTTLTVARCCLIEDSTLPPSGDDDEEVEIEVNVEFERLESPSSSPPPSNAAALVPSEVSSSILRTRAKYPSPVNLLYLSARLHEEGTGQRRLPWLVVQYQ